MPLREEQRAARMEKARTADQANDRKAFDKLSTLNGYPEVFSLFAGETLALRLARKPGTKGRSGTVARVEIRDAVSGTVVHAAERRAELLEQAPASYRDDGAGYACRIALSTGGWAPSVYETVAQDEAGNRSACIHFNIKPSDFADCDVACALPSFTWQAYNRVGGGSFYNTSLGAKRVVSTQRPIGSTDDNSIAGSLPFLAAFRETGARVACIDSADLHDGTLPTGDAKVMALLTHDEYWTREMRAHVDRHLERGGVLLVAAGNVCWWQIEADGHNLIAEKHRGGSAHAWYKQGKPEERSFVAAFRFGGYAVERVARKKRLAHLLEGVPQDTIAGGGAVTITAPDHPIFEGITGASFGGEVPILYREVDAVPLKDDGSLDRTQYDADDVEPKVLATGLVAGGPARPELHRAGVIVEAKVSNGHVLHLGSFGWSRGLKQNNAAVKRVVTNALSYCRGLR